MIDYKGFIEQNFFIKNKKGQVVPFIFNETQNYYYDLLLKEYETLEGVRENILKFRQPGFSSLIDGIFTTDFIFASEKKIASISGQIISHKDEETKVLFRRVDFFLSCYFDKAQIDRKKYLKTDTSGYLESFSGAELFIGTAGAKTLGRGGTLQNLHWSEVGFYPNTEILNAKDLITGAEQQVADSVGKIFRESTGNISGDFFSDEYEAGKSDRADFKSRFLGWWLHKEYNRTPPIGWDVPSYYQDIRDKYAITDEQCYWHFVKTDQLRDKKKMREYPTDDTEAFLMGGDQYFDSDSLLWYHNNTKEPMKEHLIYV